MAFESMMFGATSFIWILYAFLWLFPVAYLILRWRAYREQAPNDPHLGVKSALYYFKTLAYHVMLVGTFCLIFGLINDHIREQMMRMGAGLLLGGAIIYGAHAFIIDKRTNPLQFPAVARIYNGFNLVMTGLVAMAAVIPSSKAWSMLQLGCFPSRMASIHSAIWRWVVSTRRPSRYV